MLMPMLNRSPERSHSLPSTLKDEFHVLSMIYVLLLNKTYFNVKKKIWKNFENIFFHKVEKFHGTGAWNYLKFSGNT